MMISSLLLFVIEVTYQVIRWATITNSISPTTTHKTYVDFIQGWLFLDCLLLQLFSWMLVYNIGVFIVIIMRRIMIIRISATENWTIR